MDYKKIFKFISIFLPNFFIFGTMNILMRLKYGVKIGKRSKIYLNSYFEGANVAMNNTEVQGSYMGRFTYIASDSKIRLSKIGRFCSIAENVKLGVGIHPSRNFVSTCPAFYQEDFFMTFTKSEKFPPHIYIDECKKYAVEVGNDVWIGSNVVVMDGIKIGNGAIVGAGAIVTKDVPDYAIVGGVPARLIRYRFTDEQIKFLQDFKWWDRDLKWIKENYEDFSNIEKFIEKNA